jgi:hypothetical protein
MLSVIGYPNLRSHQQLCHRDEWARSAGKTSADDAISPRIDLAVGITILLRVTH